MLLLVYILWIVCMVNSQEGSLGLNGKLKKEDIAALPILNFKDYSHENNGNQHPKVKVQQINFEHQKPLKKIQEYNIVGTALYKKSQQPSKPIPMPSPISPPANSQPPVIQKNPIQKQKQTQQKLKPIQKPNKQNPTTKQKSSQKSQKTSTIKKITPSPTKQQQSKQQSPTQIPIHDINVMHYVPEIKNNQDDYSIVKTIIYPSKNGESRFVATYPKDKFVDKLLGKQGTEDGKKQDPVLKIKEENINNNAQSAYKPKSDTNIPVKQPQSALQQKKAQAPHQPLKSLNPAKPQSSQPNSLPIFDKKVQQDPSAKINISKMNQMNVLLQNRQDYSIVKSIIFPSSQNSKFGPHSSTAKDMFVNKLKEKNQKQKVKTNDNNKEKQTSQSQQQNHTPLSPTSPKSPDTNNNKNSNPQQPHQNPTSNQQSFFQKPIETSIPTDSKDIKFKQHQLGKPQQIKSYDFDKIIQVKRKDQSNTKQTQQKPSSDNNKVENKQKNDKKEIIQIEKQKQEGNKQKTIQSEKQLDQKVKEYVQQAQKRLKRQQQASKNSKNKHITNTPIQPQQDSASKTQLDGASPSSINLNHKTNQIIQQKQKVTLSEQQQYKVYIIKLLIIIIIACAFILNYCNSNKPENNNYEPVEFGQTEDNLELGSSSNDKIQRI